MKTIFKVDEAGPRANESTPPYYFDLQKESSRESNEQEKWDKNRQAGFPVFPK
jgi:hypothetical protein